MPVEVFSPKTKANITTMMMPMPLMPDLDNPNKLKGLKDEEIAQCILIVYLQWRNYKKQFGLITYF